MRKHELAGIMLERFRPFIDEMDEVVSDKEPIAQSGEEKLFFRVFVCPGKEENPLAKISFSIWRDVKMKNKDDKNVFDPTEAVVAIAIPKDGLPLPMCLLEGAFHLDKYAYCLADLAPLSTDESYREVFCRPVQELRKKHDDLPGLSPAMPDSRLQDFTSGGMLRGEIDLRHKDTVVKWLLDYVDLYLKFVNERKSYSVLRNPSIIEESRERKSVLCGTFKKTMKLVLDGVPGLRSDQLAERLGEMHF